MITADELLLELGLDTEDEDTRAWFDLTYPRVLKAFETKCARSFSPIEEAVVIVDGTGTAELIVSDRIRELTSVEYRVSSAWEDLGEPEEFLVNGFFLLSLGVNFPCGIHNIRITADFGIESQDDEPEAAYALLRFMTRLWRTRSTGMTAFSGVERYDLGSFHISNADVSTIPKTRRP